MKLINMYPKDNMDDYLVVSEMSLSLTGAVTKRYYGGGHCWFNSQDQRVGDWKSADLHRCWNEANNLRLEIRNCK